MTRRTLRQKLLPTPDEILEGYLTGDERFLLVDEPSTNAFMVGAANEIALIVAIALATGFLVGKGAGAVLGLLGFIAVTGLAVVLVVQRLQAWYTRYALTDFRVIRSWGVVSRQMAWIPWSKVTDVSVHQSAAGRLLGYATVRIESANEASGFKEIKDLREPHRFHRFIAEIVEEKQGKYTPPALVGADGLEPPTSSL